ncbi:MAG: glycosyltransferase family 2 protein, partial [Thioalkalivibrio sp.]|nr:glycosyltransferase family 2 protein [Thioalkalivibrio sp.]
MGVKVHVVLLNWNGWPDTEECLDSLVRSDHYPLTVTVVDNASTDDSVQGFGRWAGRLNPDAAARVAIDLIRTEQNLGFAGGNNRGIRHALEHGADYVLVLNNDTVVEPDAVSELVAVSESSGAAMVAPAVFDYACRDRVDRFGVVLTRNGSAYDRVSDDDGPLLCPSGCAGLYRRDLIEVLDRDAGGFFDEAFFLYSEDLDVGLRATARGYPAAFAPRSRIYHKGSASWGLGAPRAYYLRHRNTLWTIAKNYSRGLLVRESAHLVAGQLLGLMGALRRRRFRAVLKG